MSRHIFSNASNLPASRVALRRQSGTHMITDPCFVQKVPASHEHTAQLNGWEGTNSDQRRRPRKLQIPILKTRNPSSSNRPWRLTRLRRILPLLRLAGHRSIPPAAVLVDSTSPLVEDRNTHKVVVVEAMAHQVPVTSLDSGGRSRLVADLGPEGRTFGRSRWTPPSRRGHREDSMAQRPRKSRPLVVVGHLSEHQTTPARIPCDLHGRLAVDTAEAHQLEVRTCCCPSLRFVRNLPAEP